MKDKTITVLQIIPNLISGGVERGVIDIAVALKEAGFVSLVTSKGGPLVSALDRHGVRHISLNLSSKNPFIILFNALRLAALI